MSYNIDSITIIAQNEFTISESNFANISEDECPESWEFETSADLIEHTKGGSFPWHGEWSGRSFDKLKEVLSLFTGSADMVLIWEGGDSTSGLRVVDGQVTEHKVLFTLGEQT